MKMKSVSGYGMGLMMALFSMARAEQPGYKVALVQVFERTDRDTSLTSMRRDPIHGLNEDCAKALQDFLPKQGRLIVTDWGSVLKAAVGAGLDVTKELPAADAVKLGKTLGVDYVILATENMTYMEQHGIDTDEVVLDGSLVLTLQVLKTADGAEVMKKSRMGSPSKRIPAAKAYADGGKALLQAGGVEALANAANNFRELLQEPFPILGSITAVKDAKKRLVDVDFGKSVGAGKGDNFVILDASGKAVGEMELQDVQDKASTAKFAKKSEAVAQAGAQVKSGKL